MTLFDILAILLTLSALFSFINYRFIRLPTTIGLMLIALLMSLGLIALDRLGLGLREPVGALLAGIDFNQTLMQGMLSFLLFAGALHINLNDLARQKWIIGLLATFGVLLSTAMVGLLTWILLGVLGIELPLIYCLLFGAVISPTDPIAVLGLLKRAGVPKSLETKIAGESLFNDGVGVVVFLVLLDIAVGGHETEAGDVALLFAREALGGAVFGLAAGLVTFLMLRGVDRYPVEILLTLALVTGGYALAQALHISGPIAIVVAGLLIGNHGRVLAMSERTREHLDTFWELVDEILNAVLFVMIGLEVLVLSLAGQYLLAGVLVIPVVLLARWLAVGVPVTFMRVFRDFSPGAVRVLTWGGLRGGISVALALSVPAGPARDVLLTVTYVVVVFSILVQGLTVGRVVTRAPA
ncbi:MAG: sodium:proton antiporter [Gammaproteobacteria bacterium]|nr:sodium:proton antiporter [Gammaproteobacteria bacterium]NIR98423.1 sodium:proton antiporter [Gammaproteobacteria bacterium]NIT64170.1 sodium:proton antiporter [Gammaproteobacteria bacterium]NIV21110.1 sodium:proton antiporter [Gammaproteobacteria bacterium]NIX10587.1 sodium:proton antiporter [Gammaproteobacteria bacterium]